MARPLARRGLPFEFPGSPAEVSQNFGYVLDYFSRHQVLRLVAQTKDPKDPPRGEGQLYVFDDGVTVELRIRYNDAGTLKTGSVALA